MLKKLEKPPFSTKTVVFMVAGAGFTARVCVRHFCLCFAFAHPRSASPMNRRPVDTRHLRCTLFAQTQVSATPFCSLYLPCGYFLPGSRKQRSFFLKKNYLSIKPYLTLTRSSFSSIGSAANHRKITVAAAWTQSTGKPETK